MEQIAEYRGVKTYMMMSVVMEKVCHMIVNDMGSDNVFWEEIRKVKHRE